MAVGEFVLPLVTELYCSIPWLESKLPGGARLYLVGSGRMGTVDTGPRPEVSDIVRGSLGGWRYVRNFIFRGRALDYVKSSAIIWRSEKISIAGESGSLIVTYNDDDSQFYAAGFQSHELTPVIQRESTYYKIGLIPPRPLTGKFSAIITAEIHRKLGAERKRVN